MSAKRTVFVTAGTQPWYTHGVDRLQQSLRTHGYTGDIQAWKHWPDNKFPRDCVYTIKAACLHHAIREGYTTIMWGDASVYALKDVQPFINRVNSGGYWIGQSGYNCAQVCGDKMLDYFGVDRDWAEKVPDAATGIFGVNMDFDAPRKFIETWVEAGRAGAFNGSRKHDGQSSDPRFLFGRQDQAAASLILGKMGIPLGNFLDYAGFKWDHHDHLTFRVEGM